MFNKQRSFAFAVLPVAALVALTACSSSSGTQSAESESSTPSPSTASESAAAIASAFPDARNAGAIDCSKATDSGYLRQTAKVLNKTNGTALLETSEIDCYDWSGKENPSQFDGLMLTPKDSTGDKTLQPRDIAEGIATIRPWNFTVTAKAGSGAPLRGTFADRPSYKFVKSDCNSYVGNTACSGVTLCSDDPNNEQVATTVPMRALSDPQGPVVTTLQVKTLCTMSDENSTIIISGTLPTA